MNIDAHSPVGLWITKHHMIDPLQARIEMIMNKGLQIIVPKFIMPQFNIEPFTKDELIEIFGHIKPQANISKLRSIISKQKAKYE